MRAKLIFTLSKNIVYHGQQRTLYFSQFKTPKQVKADFGQNQMAHETHSLKQFFLKKTVVNNYFAVDFLRVQQNSWKFSVLRSQLTSSRERFPSNYASVRTNCSLCFKVYVFFGIYSGERK